MVVNDQWLKRFCFIVGALLLGGIARGLLWAGGRIGLYSQGDNKTHLAENIRYLERTSQLKKGGNQPNIVCILFDDLGYGDLGITGSQAAFDHIKVFAKASRRHYSRPGGVLDILDVGKQELDIPGGDVIHPRGVQIFMQFEKNQTVHSVLLGKAHGQVIAMLPIRWSILLVTPV